MMYQGLIRLSGKLQIFTTDKVSQVKWLFRTIYEILSAEPLGSLSITAEELDGERLLTEVSEWFWMAHQMPGAD